MTSFQSSELTELPVVENSQLFAQRAHSACIARAQRMVHPLKRITLGRIRLILAQRFSFATFLVGGVSPRAKVPPWPMGGGGWRSRNVD